MKRINTLTRLEYSSNLKRFVSAIESLVNSYAKTSVTIGPVMSDADRNEAQVLNEIDDRLNKIADNLKSILSLLKALR